MNQLMTSSYTVLWSNVSRSCF